jgi:hypothetical protein
MPAVLESRHSSARVARLPKKSHVALLQQKERDLEALRTQAWLEQKEQADILAALNDRLMQLQEALHAKEHMLGQRDISLQAEAEAKARAIAAITAGEGEISRAGQG